VGQLEKETSMSNMYFEDHPTDPDKVILRKPRHEDDDDIQDYKRPWIGLTYEEQEEIVLSAHSIRDAINKTDCKLKEKNT
jgi:hypothetical protein